MGIKEGKVQSKRQRKHMNKTIAENLPNLEKKRPIQVQKASGTPNRHD
jgi:hypothetical protein